MKKESSKKDAILKMQFSMAMNGSVEMLKWLGIQYCKQSNQPSSADDPLPQGFDIKRILKTIADKYGPESVGAYYGDTSDEERRRILHDFQDKESKLQYIVGNTQTGGYGINLTAAHTVVYYSNNFDLEKRLQSEDRAHRIGQSNKVTYIDLIAEKTVDEKIVKSLRNKINLATEVLGEEMKQWLV